MLKQCFLAFQYLTGNPRVQKIVDMKRKDPIFQQSVEAIKITLKHNLMELNGRMFRQDKGTGIGSNNACDYADSATNYLDELIFYTLICCTGYF